ncbi:MAG TPA: MaoC/PaaZ C-terminal domain-containing protein [Myxococcales bacterium]|nr:MaoC/PaaZ C-terminal domain-containing protein [Myxococcales bacterium]
MSSRSTAKKIRPALKAAAKVAKVAKPKPPPRRKLAKVTKFPKVGKHAVKKTAARKTSPSRAVIKAPAKPAGKKVMPPMPPLTPPRQVQEPKQSLARSFYWSELRVGDDLPPLSKQAIDRVQIARYASASNDFNRLHLDEPFAHALGFPGLFAPGMLAMGFVGQLLTAWLRRGHVRRLAARFVKIVWPGDELTCRGRIAELRKENGACYADVELWAENQKGELVLRGQATCELYESPAAGGGGDGGGLLFALQSGPIAGSPQSAAQPAKGGKPAPRKR